jgi:uncharacterized protein (DUF4415 family)
MTKRERIVRYTAEQIAAKIAGGEDRTDWAKVDATTEAEIEAQAAEDGDDYYFPPGWTQVYKGLPPRKAPINLRIDEDILDWFRKTGKGYQTRINSVLRAFVESRRDVR